MDTNLLDLNGPAFLGLYILLLIVAAGAAAYLRWRHYYGPSEESGTALPHLDAYEIAYLAGGSDRVMNTPSPASATVRRLRRTRNSTI
jgi:hypothetical protein